MNLLGWQALTVGSTAVLSSWPSQKPLIWWSVHPDQERWDCRNLAAPRIRWWISHEADTQLGLGEYVMEEEENWRLNKWWTDETWMNEWVNECVLQKRPWQSSASFFPQGRLGIELSISPDCDPSKDNDLGSQHGAYVEITEWTGLHQSPHQTFAQPLPDEKPLRGAVRHGRNSGDSWVLRNLQTY